MDLNMFIPEVQVLEKIARPLIVYFFLLLMFRITGKRELGQMTGTCTASPVPPWRDRRGQGAQYE